MSFSQVSCTIFQGFLLLLAASFFTNSPAIPSKPSGRGGLQEDLQNLAVPPWTFVPKDFNMYDVVVAVNEEKVKGPKTADPDGRHPKKPVGNYGLFFRDFCEGSWVISYIIHE